MPASPDPGEFPGPAVPAGLSRGRHRIRPVLADPVLADPVPDRHRRGPPRRTGGPGRRRVRLLPSGRARTVRAVPAAAWPRAGCCWPAWASTG